MAAGLAWLGGANNDILDKVPTERSRFVQMALVLLTTSGIGTLSMMFALDDGVHTPLPVAIIGGIVWGLIILNIDRFLVVNMGHTRDWKKLLLMALPRLALAAVISIVVATPLTLRIFQHDINNQMMIQQTNESTQMSQDEQNTIPAKELASVNAQITKWNNVLAGNLAGITPSTPQLAADQKNVASLTAQVNAAQTTMDNAYDKWNCEVNGAGTNCAAGTSTIAGNGPRAQNDYMSYTQDKASYDNLSSQLTAAEGQEAGDQQTANANAKSSLASEQATARAKLPGLQQEQTTLQNEVNQQDQSNANNVSGNNGILAQLQALSDAGATDPILTVAQWVVTLLFFFIEILPVMVKLLLNIGPLSLYEVALKHEEDSSTDEMKTSRVTRRRDIERNALKQQTIDEDMRQREEELGKMANAHVAAHMEAILKQALVNWSMQVQSQLGGQVPGGAPGAGNPVPQRRATGPLRRLGITSPQPSVNNQNGTGYGNGAGYNNRQGYGTGSTQGLGNGAGYGGGQEPDYGSGTGYDGARGGGASGFVDDGYGPTATYPASPGAGIGFELPIDDGDLL
jgi:Domain of unknown function (DUF4407)